MHERSERRAGREVGQRRRDGAQYLFQQIRTVLQHGERGNRRLVLPLLDLQLRLAADARVRRHVVVQEPGEPGIRGAPPAFVQRRSNVAASAGDGSHEPGLPAGRPVVADVLDGNGPVGDREQINQPPAHVYVAHQPDSSRRLFRGVEVAEQQPAQRRVLGGRRRHPPGDDLAAGPGHRDVEQAQVLAQLLGEVQVPPIQISRPVAAADVQQACVVVVQA